MRKIIIRDFGREEEVPTFTKALNRLAEAYKSQHVTLQFQKDSGIKMSLFVSIDDAGVVTETYGNNSPVTVDSIRQKYLTPAI